MQSVSDPKRFIDLDVAAEQNDCRSKIGWESFCDLGYPWATDVVMPSGKKPPAILGGNQNPCLTPAVSEPAGSAVAADLALFSFFISAG
eukprot:s1901_g2.t1